MVAVQSNNGLFSVAPDHQIYIIELFEGVVDLEQNIQDSVNVSDTFYP